MILHQNQQEYRCFLLSSNNNHLIRGKRVVFVGKNIPQLIAYTLGLADNDIYIAV